MFHQFFFEFAWNWSSVLTGYNDEYFFHACASFGLSPGFKLNGNSQSRPSHAFSELTLTVNFISKFWRSSKFWGTLLLVFLQSLKPWVNAPSLFILFNTFFLTSILFSSVCPPWVLHGLAASWLQSILFSTYVFITNMVAKVFCPDEEID